MCSVNSEASSQAATRALVMYSNDASDYHALCHCIDRLEQLDPQAITLVCHTMAQHATKDMSWKQALTGPDADKAIV